MIHKMIPNKKKASDLSLVRDCVEMIICSDKCASQDKIHLWLISKLNQIEKVLGWIIVTP